MNNLLTCYNQEYETAFIGRCIAETGFALNWVGKITLGHFHDSNAQKVFHIISEIVQRGKEPSFLEVSQCFNDPWLLETMENYSSKMDDNSLFFQLDKYKRFRSVARIIIQMSKKIPEDEDAIENAVEELISVSSQNKNKHQEYSMERMAAVSVERWEKDRNDRRIFEIGIEKIDKYLRLRPGNLLYVVAPPKTGKTWLLCSMAAQLCHRKHRTYFISAEMHPQDLYSRIASYVSGVNVMDFDDPNTPRRLYSVYSEHLEILNKMPLMIVEAVGINFVELQAKIRSAALRGFDVVIIDYLQRIHKPDARDLRIATTQLSVMLADTARKYNILIICASQASRLANKEKITEIYHAKESGSIEADADALITLTDTTEYNELTKPETREITFKLAQRNGDGGVFKMEFHPSIGKFQ